MHTFNESFEAEQSGAYPKGVQVTYMAVVGSSWHLVYIGPKVQSPFLL